MVWVQKLLSSKSKNYHRRIYATLRDDIKEKGPEFVKKNIFFNQDNAPFHTSYCGMAVICELKFEMLQLAPYSTDFISSFLNISVKTSRPGWSILKAISNSWSAIFIVAQSALDSIQGYDYQQLNYSCASLMHALYALHY